MVIKKMLLVTVLMLLSFVLIMAIARPELIHRQYISLREPIDRYIAQKNYIIWREAKETEKAKWMLRLQLPKDCATPVTALRRLACNNMLQIQAQAFEQDWSNKIRNGWKPEGLHE
jgi:hypothetical protein